MLAILNRMYFPSLSIGRVPSGRGSLMYSHRLGPSFRVQNIEFQHFFFFFFFGGGGGSEKNECFGGHVDFVNIWGGVTTKLDWF